MNLNHMKFDVVGLKQVTRALEAKELERVYLASDAEASIREDIIQRCRESGAELIQVPTMRELGKAAGISVGAAVAGVTRPAGDSLPE